MNNKSIFLLIAVALTSLTLINCSSDNKEQKSEPNVHPELSLQAGELVSSQRPNDFPAGSTVVTMDESLGSFVVTSQESGCRILVKQEGSELSVDSEVDCSQ